MFSLFRFKYVFLIVFEQYIKMKEMAETKISGGHNCI
jgi:hypothetical protein